MLPGRGAELGDAAIQVSARPRERDHHQRGPRATTAPPKGTRFLLVARSRSRPPPVRHIPSHGDWCTAAGVECAPSACGTLEKPRLKGSRCLRPDGSSSSIFPCSRRPGKGESNAVAASMVVGCAPARVLLPDCSSAGAVVCCIAGGTTGVRRRVHADGDFSARRRSGPRRRRAESGATRSSSTVASAGQRRQLFDLAGERTRRREELGPDPVKARWTEFGQTLFFHCRRFARTLPSSCWTP